MIKEFDVVALTRDLEGTHIRKGDLGTVVDILSEGKAYIVEFVLQTGFTAALEDVKATDVRSLEEGEYEQKLYREWKPEWTGILGYVPPISEIPDSWVLKAGRPNDAHFINYLNGEGA